MLNYVRNDSKKQVQKGIKNVIIRVSEAFLFNSLSKLPGTKIFYKLFYESQEFTSKPKSSHKWNEFCELKLEKSEEILIILYSKIFLFGIKEIGSCQVHTDEFFSKKLKKNLINSNTVIGAVEIFINLPNLCTISTQSTCNSLDMREDNIKPSHLEINGFKAKKTDHFFDTKEKALDTSCDENEEYMVKYIEKVSNKKKKINKRKPGA